MTPEQRAKRIHHHMYETCEGIAEHAERIVALEELVCNVHDALRADKAGMFHKLILSSMEDDMRELGIEV